MASRSVQPFSQGSWMWPTDGQTDRHTDKQRYSGCSSSLYLASAAMRPNDGPKILCKYNNSNDTHVKRFLIRPFMSNNIKLLSIFNNTFMCICVIFVKVPWSYLFSLFSFSQCYKYMVDWFYASSDTKQVIQRRSSQPISWLSTDKLKHTQQKQTYIHNKIYHNIQLTHKKLKPGLVAFYDLRPGDGMGLFWKE